MSDNDGFRGWDIDHVQWDELDRFDIAEAIVVFSHRIDAFGRQMIEAIASVQALPPRIEELPKLTGEILPSRVGKYEKPGPNYRRFKRNARRQRK